MGWSETHTFSLPFVGAANASSRRGIETIGTFIIRDIPTKLGATLPKL
jgi:hypothetical protein